MNKIPVGETIASAYKFTFTQLGSIIGLSWVSLIAIAVLQFLPYAGGGNPAAAPANPLQAGQQAIQSLGISILALLLFAIIYVAVTRLALGQKPGGAIFHFSLGLPEFRVFGAIILLLLVFIGLALLLVIGAGIGVALTNGLNDKAVAALALAVFLLMFLCAFVFVATRLGFLLAPVTVAEEHISLSRGWILTQGNFWRILGIALATSLPLVMIELIAVAVIMGPELSALLSNGAQSDPQAFSARLGEIMAHHAPVLIGLRLVFAPFQLGLSLGASAFAYRSLTPPAK